MEPTVSDSVLRKAVCKNSWKCLLRISVRGNFVALPWIPAKVVDNLGNPGGYLLLSNLLTISPWRIPRIQNSLQTVSCSQGCQTSLLKPLWVENQGAWLVPITQNQKQVNNFCCPGTQCKKGTSGSFATLAKELCFIVEIIKESFLGAGVSPLDFLLPQWTT